MQLGEINSLSDSLYTWCFFNWKWNWQKDSLKLENHPDFHLIFDTAMEEGTILG